MDYRISADIYFRDFCLLTQAIYAEILLPQSREPVQAPPPAVELSLIHISSRRLMKECCRNVELFYLLNRLKPDFRTIADFRKDNRKALEAVSYTHLDVYKRQVQ